MASTSLFESFLTSQGYALFESLGAGEFSVVGDCPAWCRDIFAIHSVPGKPVHLDERSPFLENFLVDAEEFWNSKSEGSANSGKWIERDKHGREVPLEVFALSLDRKNILILRNLSANFVEQQQWFQTARDALLAHERLLGEIQKKEILLHCIIHDLSQPLSAMSGCFNLLRLAKLPAKLSKYVEAGQRESQRQEAMIRGILSAFSGDLAAQQSGTEETAPPDLAACAQQAIEEFSSAFKDKNVRLRFDPQSNESVNWHVRGDAPRLDRIFGNLLENTLRYSPPASTVTVGLKDDGSNVFAFVDDEGPGLPPDLPSNQLFALFSKGKSHSGKAGLGLYFCKITVERWGGAIGAETRPQGGSRFWFRVPRASRQPQEGTSATVSAQESEAAKRSSAAVNSAVSAPTSRRNKPVKRLRILVTEDTELNRELVLELLKNRGHSVASAADGLEALAALEHSRFDVVLMDEEMPRMNGLEATRAIRRMETSTGRHAYIIGLTGNATEQDERRCLDAGMDAFIAKPVRMERLYQVVESGAEPILGAKPASESSIHANATPAATKDEIAAAHLHRATGGNQKLQRTLITAFLEDAPKTLSLIRRAATTKDGKKLASSAHALKGSIAIFGATNAVAIARELEAMGRANDLLAADSKVDALHSEFVRLKTELLALYSPPKTKGKSKGKPKSKSPRAR
jgi:signal transduction histidine kinase/DNA-binding NarL/FixJ family response regulator